MKNDFDVKMKKIEAELLALKTASEFSSIRTANIRSSSQVTTGLYRINYDARGEAIISAVYEGLPTYCRLFPRTPSGNSQIVEVLTTTWNNDTQSYDDFPNYLVVVSNVPVTSIVRI